MKEEQSQDLQELKNMTKKNRVLSTIIAILICILFGIGGMFLGSKLAVYENNKETNSNKTKETQKSNKKDDTKIEDTKIEEETVIKSATYIHYNIDEVAPIEYEVTINDQEKLLELENTINNLEEYNPEEAGGTLLPTITINYKDGSSKELVIFDFADFVVFDGKQYRQSEKLSIEYIESLFGKESDENINTNLESATYNYYDISSGNPVEKSATVTSIKKLHQIENIYENRGKKEVDGLGGTLLPSIKLNYKDGKIVEFTIFADDIIVGEDKVPCYPGVELNENNLNNLFEIK